MADNIYRPLIVVLLLVLVGVLALQTIPVFFRLSSACNAARVQAKAVTALGIPLITEYEAAVYDKAENINQQQFLAVEYSFVTLQVIAEQNEAIIGLLTACP